MHWGQSRRLLLQTVCDLSSKGRAACCIQMGSLEKVSEQDVNHTSLTQLPPNNEVWKIKDNFSLKTWKRGSQEEETGCIPRGFKLTKHNNKKEAVSQLLYEERSYITFIRIKKIIVWVITMLPVAFQLGGSEVDYMKLQDCGSYFSFASQTGKNQDAAECENWLKGHSPIAALKQPLQRALGSCSPVLGGGLGRMAATPASRPGPSPSQPAQP